MALAVQHRVREVACDFKDQSILSGRKCIGVENRAIDPTIRIRRGIDQRRVVWVLGRVADASQQQGCRVQYVKTCVVKRPMLFEALSQPSTGVVPHESSILRRLGERISSAALPRTLLKLRSLGIVCH